VWDVSRRLLLVAVMGGLGLDEWLRAAANVHWRLAHSRRNRKPHVFYPLRR